MLVKNFLLPTISAVVGGLIVAFLVSSSSQIDLDAEVNWIDTELTADLSWDYDLDSLSLLSRGDNESADLTEFKKMLERLSDHRPVRVYSIILSNNNDRRSSEIELNISRMLYALKYFGASETKGVFLREDESLTVEALDPNESVKVVVFSQESSGFQPSLNIIHEGKIVHYDERKLPNRSFGIVSLVSKYVPWSEIAVFVLVIISAMSVGSVFLESYFEKHPAKRVAYQKDVAKKMIVFSETLKKEDPALWQSVKPDDNKDS